MSLLETGIPLGRLFGVNIRLHISFLLYAFYRIQAGGNPVFNIIHIVGLYGCILLHELGHALATRWCNGEAEDILLWPLGGLAYTRPPWHPTAHLISTVAGPTVTLALWLGFELVGWVLANVFSATGFPAIAWLRLLFATMARLNRWLLLFNLIPAFPMDGGRIFRDLLWFWLGVGRATRIAVGVSRMLAIIAGVWAVMNGEYWIVMLAIFIFLQSSVEYRLLAWQERAGEPFSLRECLHRRRRRQAFASALSATTTDTSLMAFHRCAECGRTELDNPALDFRVCPDCSNGEEYCEEHLNGHEHR